MNKINNNCNCDKLLHNKEIYIYILSNKISNCQSHFKL